MRLKLMLKYSAYHPLDTKIAEIAQDEYEPFQRITERQC